VPEKKRRVEKYPRLYQNGYLNLEEITQLPDLMPSADYIEADVNQLRVQPQWVRCKASWTLRLQAFCAAPSFQNASIDWTNISLQHNYDRRISIALLRAHYEASAQMARLSRGPLHPTAVGIGTFNNPPETLDVALGASLQVLKGSGVKVFLHGYSLEDIKKWNRALNNNSSKPVQFDPNTPRFSPITQPQNQPIDLDSLRDPVFLEASNVFLLTLVTNSTSPVTTMACLLLLLFLLWQPSFDCDGVTPDIEGRCYEFSKAQNPMHLLHVPDPSAIQDNGRTLKRTLDWFLPDPPILQQQFGAQVIKFESEMRFPSIPGVSSLMEEVKSRGVKSQSTDQISVNFELMRFRIL
jgi:hypothetical protein